MMALEPAPFGIPLSCAWYNCKRPSVHLDLVLVPGDTLPARICTLVSLRTKPAGAPRTVK